MNAASGNESDGVGSNTWTDNNTVTSGTGLLGNARLFTAANSEYFSAPSGFIDGYAAWSFEVWFKPTSTALGSNWPRIIDFGTGTGKYLFVTVRSSTVGGSRPSVGLLVGGTEYQSGLPAVLVADVWHQLIVTAKNGRVAVFLDGVCVSGVSGRNAAGTNLTPTQAYLGKSQWADPYYDGLMDQCRLWSRELTPQDVTALYNGGTPLALAALSGTSVPAAPTPNANGRLAYQMFSFNESGETLSMFESSDGIYWTNYSTSLSPPTGAVRDPTGCLWNGVWRVAYTRTAAGATTFGVAEASSGALTSWTEIASVDCSGASGGADYVWAPEFARNADGSVYTDAGDGRPRVIVAISSTVSANFVPHVVYPTNDGWTTWSTPAAITGTAIPANCIDGFPINMGGGVWKMWAKNEATAAILLLTSSSLTSGWDTSASDPGSWGTGSEGFSAFKIGSTWLIYADRYGTSNGVGYATSGDDFATVSRLSGCAADVLPRHGTVVYVPDAAPGGRTALNTRSNPLGVEVGMGWRMSA